MTTALRNATVDDLPSIRQVIADAYAIYADRMDRPPAPVLNDYLAETEAGQVWVVGTPIAGVLVLVAGKDSLLVENIAVAPSRQGSGLGRRLMKFAEQRAAELGLPRVSLYTNVVMTENLAIYERLGYREVERRAESGYSRVFLEKSTCCSPG
ncbi:MAG TPA: GNAT family N-acetyltransferase [Streptosporangiaceae bacterium]